MEILRSIKTKLKWGIPLVLMLAVVGCGHDDDDDDDDDDSGDTTENSNNNNNNNNSSGPGTVSFSSDADWIAIVDGPDGTWMRLQPSPSAALTSPVDYSVDISDSEGRFGIVVVCDETSTAEVFGTLLTVGEFNGSLAAYGLATSCNGGSSNNSTQHNVQVDVTNSLGEGSISLPGIPPTITGTNQTLNGQVIEGTYVLGAATGTTFEVADKIFINRTIDISGDVAIPVDFTSSTFAGDINRNINVVVDSNGADTELTSFNGGFTLGYTAATSDVNRIPAFMNLFIESFSGASETFSVGPVPSALADTTNDSYVLTASGVGQSSAISGSSGDVTETRTRTRYARQLEATNFSLPSGWAVTSVNKDTTDPNYPIFSVNASLYSDVSTGDAELYWMMYGGWQFFVSSGWLTGASDLQFAFPNLSALDGWNTNWNPEAQTFDFFSLFASTLNFIDVDGNIVGDLGAIVSKLGTF